LIQERNKSAIPLPAPTAPTLVSKDPTPLFQRIVVHPALRDFGLTAATSFLVAIAAMVVISLVGRTLGPVLLGEYLLIRRMASWLQAGVQLPSAVALPRYVAISFDEPHSIRQTYFLAALLTGCGIALLLDAILIIWRTALSHLFFGSAQLDHLVVPFSLLLLGLAAHVAVFGYYQGILAMGRACTLQVNNLVVIPILATELLKQRHSVALIVNAIGISMIVSTCLFALPIVYKLEVHVSVEQIKRQTTELLSYGFARVAGDFGLQVILSLPAVIALHYLPIGSVSFLLLGGSFLSAVAAATLPLGIILLSRVSRSVAGMRASELRLRVTHLVSALVGISAFACCQLIVFSGAIVRIWVGPSFLEGIRVIQIVILAVPFYFFYAGLQSVINAAAVKAHNTRNILVSVGVFLLFISLVNAFIPSDHLLEGFAASGVVGLAALASCTLRTVRRLFQIDIKWVQVMPGLGLAVMLGLLSFSLHGRFLNQPSLLVLLLYEAMVVGIYFFILWISDSPWVLFFLNTLFPRIPMKQKMIEQ
jgi:O-antigen/teichoic acid export membrane protein